MSSASTPAELYEGIQTAMNDMTHFILFGRSLVNHVDAYVDCSKESDTALRQLRALLDTDIELLMARSKIGIEAKYIEQVYGFDQKHFLVEDDLAAVLQRRLSVPLAALLESTESSLKKRKLQLEEAELKLKDDDALLVVYREKQLTSLKKLAVSGNVDMLQMVLKCQEDVCALGKRLPSSTSGTAAADLDKYTTWLAEIRARLKNGEVT